jgi:hypothetical protein
MGGRSRIGRAIVAAFELLGALVMTLIVVGTVPLLIQSYERGYFIGVRGVFTFPDWPVKPWSWSARSAALLCFLVRARQLWRGRARRRARRHPGPADNMDPVVVGVLSVFLIVVLIWCGSYVAITLSIVSFVGVWLLRGDMTIAMRMMTLAVTDSIKSYDFASIPDLRDDGLYRRQVRDRRRYLRGVPSSVPAGRGGLGIATVAANAAFAAVTGSSIASASVFTRISVPEMIRYGYGKRFAVGVVAGSSVLGMLIPPSVMLIIYAFVSEQSVGDMFIAGIVPGLLLSARSSRRSW